MSLNLSEFGFLPQLYIFNAVNNLLPALLKISQHYTCNG